MNQALLNRIISDDTLETAYQWLIANRTHIELPVWEILKPQLQTQLLSGEYCFQPVTLAHTINRLGEPETQEVWHAQDQVVLKAVSLVLKEHLKHEFSSSCYHLEDRGGIKKAVRKTRDYVQAHPQSWVMKTDVQGYYAHIDHFILHQQLCALLPEETYLQRLIWQYLKRSVYDGGNYSNIEQGISLGCPLSPLMMALYLKPLDDLFVETTPNPSFNKEGSQDVHFSFNKEGKRDMHSPSLPRRGLGGDVFYARFMDDFVVIAPTRWNLQNQVAEVQSVLDNLKLEQVAEKTVITRTDRAFDFLGYHFAPTALTVTQKTLQRRDARIARLYEQSSVIPTPSVIPVQTGIESLWMDSHLRGNDETFEPDRTRVESARYSFEAKLLALGSASLLATAATHSHAAIHYVTTPISMTGNTNIDLDGDANTDLRPHCNNANDFHVHSGGSYNISLGGCPATSVSYSCLLMPWIGDNLTHIISFSLGKTGIFNGWLEIQNLTCNGGTVNRYAYDDTGCALPAGQTTTCATAAGFSSTPAPGTINVGSATVGLPVSTTLSISEIGTAQLNVTSLALSGTDAAEFSVSPTTLSIADGGAAQTVTLTCTPTTAAAKTATLTVTHNGTGTITNPTTYTLNCTGVAAPVTPTGTPAISLDPTYTLTIKTSGKGTGMIGYQTSDITGKAVRSLTECSKPEGCTYTLPTTSWIKLTGTPDGNSEFNGFAGNVGDCSDGLVFLLKNTSCTAYFDLKAAPHVAFSVTKSVGGTIKSGDVCSASDYNQNSPVGLLVVPDQGYEFVGFAGDPDCADGLLTLDKSKNCNAVFRLQAVTTPTAPVNHSITIKVSGEGKVTSTPAGIDCGTVCTGNFAEGQHINLIAVPGENSKFQGFVGDPACAEGHFDARSALTCEAQFVQIPKTEPGNAKFAVSNFERPEGVYTLTVTVKREGGKDGVLIVNYQTRDGTALAGKEYTAAQGTLTWADGDIADKVILIELLDESVIEEDELNITEEVFYVLLTGADGTPLDKAEISLLETHHVQPHPQPGQVEIPTIKAQPIMPIPDSANGEATSTNGETCLPKDNKLNWSCNAEWPTLVDFQIQEKGHLSAANITGKLTIHATGWAGNLKLQGKASIQGGILTGYITCENDNVITDMTEFKGAVLKGCTLEGTILNTSRLEGKGLIRDVKLKAGAKVKGGRMGGKIEGDANAPALLDWLDIDQGSELSNVIIGKHVSMAPGVKQDDSVEFESSVDK